MILNSASKKIVKIIISRKKKIAINIKGNSMNPFLHNDDSIIICKKHNYCIGDIVVFYYKKDNMFLIHRIVFMKGKFIYLKGDNAYRIEKVIKKDIVGFVPEKRTNKYLLYVYCHVSYKLGKYSKRVKYDMIKIHSSHYYKKSKVLQEELLLQ